MPIVRRTPGASLPAGIFVAPSGLAKVLSSAYISLLSAPWKWSSSKASLKPLPFLDTSAYGHLFSWASCRTHVCTIHLVLILEVLGEQRTYQTRYRQNPDVHLLYYNTCENQKVFKTGWSKFQWKNFRHHDAPWKRLLWYEIRSTL